MSRASSLFRLQELDLELEGHHHRIEEIRHILEDDEEYKRCVMKLEGTEAALREKGSAKLKAEHEVASQKAKIVQTERALYSGTVSNPKVLQDRQKEAESLKRFLVTLEDRLLETMIDHEDAEGERDAAREQLDCLKESMRVQHADLELERQQRLAHISRLETEHEAALANIPSDDLNLYTTLRKRSGGVAIALVEEGTCGVCGVILARSVQQATYSGNDLIRCIQCNRILYSG